MRVTIEKTQDGTQEAFIRCPEVTSEIETIVKFIENSGKRLICYLNKKQYAIDPQEVLYLESVDQKTFIYTQNLVLQTAETLVQLEPKFSIVGFFRCSKSMIVNIYQIQSLKSEPGNKINAEMKNGDHVIISRRYAKQLRLILKGAQE